MIGIVGTFFSFFPRKLSLKENNSNSIYHCSTVVFAKITNNSKLLKNFKCAAILVKYRIQIGLEKFG